MRVRLPEPVFLLSSCLLAMALYWPTLGGLPIWDDVSFWLDDPTLRADFPYSKIWSDYAWPLSVSFQKWAYSVWGPRFEVYHVISVFLHLLNSLLVYQLGSALNWPWRRWVFLLFLVHPANVIAVSWMIQVKTLLCFLFSTLSFLSLSSAFSGALMFFPLAWIFFFLAVASKAASVTLPLIFLLFAASRIKGRQLVRILPWLLPFFLISGWGATRLLGSDVTQQASKHVLKQYVAVTKPAPTATPAPAPQVAHPWKVKSDLAVKTLNYYFWHAIAPVENHPVKGFGAVEIEGLRRATVFVQLALAALAFLFWRTSFWYLLCGYVLLLPYIGIFPAPFMNITPVSDQHLYFAVPFFLAFWLAFWPALWHRLTPAVPLLLLVFFAYQSARSTPYYRDEIAFFSASLAAEPGNVPVAHNLASTHFAEGRTADALGIIDEILKRAEASPEIKASRYLPDLLELRREILASGTSSR